MPSAEVEIVITATDDASGVIAQVKGELADLASSGATGGGVGGGIAQMGADATETGFSMMGLIGSMMGVTMGVNMMLRGAMQYEQQTLNVRDAQEALTKAQLDNDQLLVKYAGDTDAAAAIQQHNSDTISTASDILGGNNKLQQAATKYMMDYNATQAEKYGKKAQYITQDQAELDIANKLVASNQNVIDKTQTLETRQDQLTIAASRLGVGVLDTGVKLLAAAVFIDKLGGAGAVASGVMESLGGGLSTVEGWLTGTGDEALLAGNEMLGLGEGGISAGEALSLTGESATVAAEGVGEVGVEAAGAGIGLGTVGAFVAAFGLSSVLATGYAKGLSTTLDEMGREVQSSAPNWSVLGADIMTISNPIATVGSGFRSILQSMQLLPAEMPTVSQELANLGNIGANAFTDLSQTVTESFHVIQSSAGSTIDNIASSIESIPTDVTTTITVIGEEAAGLAASIAASIAGIVDKSVIITVTYIEHIIQEVGSAIGGAIGGAIGAVVGWLGGYSGYGAGDGGDEGFAIGGIIPRTGYYYMHANEAVIPPEAFVSGSEGTGTGNYPTVGGSGQQTINIQIPVTLDGQNIATIQARKKIQTQRTNSAYR